jgi:chorismate mutase
MNQSGRISWYRYHCLIASRPFLGNSDGIDESITTRFFSNLNSFSKELQYSDKDIVFLFFVIIPTLSQLTYFFQVKWRHYSAETLQDIAQSVTDSSRNNHNIPQLVTRFFSNLNSFSKESQYSLTKTIPGESLSARKWL